MATRTVVTTRTEAEEPEYGQHVMPRWFQWCQDNIFLSALIAAEIIINGTVMTYGIVTSITSGVTVNSVFTAIVFGVMFIAGGLMAGMSLRTSAAAAVSMRRREWGFAAFNLLGMAFFTGIEIWASITERSVKATITPADRTVLDALGFAHPLLSPTDIVISIALPVACMFWGFSHSKPASANRADVEQKWDAKLAKAEKKAQIQATRVRGWAEATKAGLGALAAAPTPAIDTPNTLPLNGKSAPLSSDNPDDDGPHGGGGLPKQTRRTSGAVSRDKSGASGGNIRQLAASQGPRRDWMNWQQVVSYLQRTYQRQISKQEALAILKGCTHWRDENAVGRPLVAKKAEIYQRAKAWINDNPRVAALDAEALAD